ncbi:MAG: heavy metal-binding domain-containing protein [Chthoniobacterales bacterium]
MTSFLPTFVSIALVGAVAILGLVVVADRQFFHRAAILLAFAALSACSITPPAVSVDADDPSNPSAAPSATRPLRPALMAGVRSFLPTSTGAGAQKMEHGGHEMSGMSGETAAPKNQAEQAVAAGVQQAPPPAVPTGEQLPSIHPADYTCPMHPEIHSDKPDKCPKCGMTLVTRASLQKNNAMEQSKP